MPPAAVLLKLSHNSSPSAARRSRSHRGVCGGGQPLLNRRATTTSKPGTSGNNLVSTSELYRKRCFSESNSKQPFEFSRRRTVAASRPTMFCLDASISKSTQRLAQIHREVSHAQNDLSGHVSCLRRQTSDGCSSYESSVDEEEEDKESSASLLRLSIMRGEEVFARLAEGEQDLQIADLARVEFSSILAELETAWACEEKDMVSRAE